MIFTNPIDIAGPGLDNFSFPADEALLVVGDSHGQADALRGALDGLSEIDTPGKRRKLVFLGDFLDRGPDSLGCLNAALFEAADRARADEVVILPGNHELMLAAALEDLDASPALARSSTDAELWVMNGGHRVLEEIFTSAGKEIPRDGAELLAAVGEALPHPGHSSFLEMVRSWPSHVQIGDVICVHAGIKPKKPHHYSLGLSQREHRVHRFHWAWIRDEFLSWQGGFPADGRKGFPDAPDGVLVLHGHTIPKSCSSGMKHPDQITRTFDRMSTNARICLDGGAAAAMGVAGCVLTDEGVQIGWQPVWPDAF